MYTFVKQRVLGPREGTTIDPQLMLDVSFIQWTTSLNYRVTAVGKPQFFIPPSILSSVLWIQSNCACVFNACPKATFGAVEEAEPAPQQEDQG